MQAIPDEKIGDVQDVMEGKEKRSIPCERSL
jgi:hypothetical protein